MRSGVFFTDTGNSRRRHQFFVILINLHDTSSILHQETTLVVSNNNSIVDLIVPSSRNLADSSFFIFNSRSFTEFRTVTALVKFEVVEAQSLVSVNIASGKGIIAEAHRNLIR